MHEPLPVLSTGRCILSALPSLRNGLGHILAGLPPDFLLQRDAAPRAFLVAVPDLGCSSTFIVVLLTLALTIISMTGAGININHTDIAHIYVGFLLGITNTFGIAAGITAPTEAGFLISQYPQSSWSNSFLLPAALSLFGLIFYTAFGSGTIQDWTEEDPAEEREPQAWEGAQGKGQDLQPPLSSS